MDPITPSADTRRAEILETAAAVFARNGVRTSVKDIADASGILKGSLYHHFESKDAILVELLERYQSDVDDVAARAAALLAEPDPLSPDELVLATTEALAACALRNRGALLQTLHELPTEISEQLERPVSEQTAAVHVVLLEMLRRGQAEGTFRPDIDLPRLADRLCQSMISAGIRMYGDEGNSVPSSEIVWAFVRDGLAVAPVTDAQLDGSAAMRAASEVIGTWHKAVVEEDERLALIRAVARAEFGRRGFRATTIRDLAAAAGMSSATVHRLIGSKDELLETVMETFSTNGAAGWRAVLDAEASTVEKLDALLWVHISLLADFSNEFRIGLAWTLESRGDAGLRFQGSFHPRLKDLTSLLASGIESGEMRSATGPIKLQARCLLELTWPPEEYAREDARGAHLFARDTVLRGAAARQPAT